MIGSPANQMRILACLCCLFISGCATNQGALFSVAPEYDKAKLSALSRSAESRRQAVPFKTNEDVKSDQTLITGFNKNQIPTRSQTQIGLEQNNVLSPKIEESESLEFDESAEFQAIELTGVSFPTIPVLQAVKEPPVEAQKPVSVPEFELIQKSTPPAPAATVQPQAVPPEPKTVPPVDASPEKKSSRLVELGLKPLTTLNLNTRPPAGDLPGNTAGQYLEKIPAEKVTMGTTREWSLVTKEWEAPAVPHNPLYFEEPYLERYGYNYGPVIQPFISAGRFFGRMPALPYMIGAYPLDECQYSLGYDRPGNCPPYQVERLPFSARGALFESLTVTGLVFLIP